MWIESYELRRSCRAQTPSPLSRDGSATDAGTETAMTHTDALIVGCASNGVNRVAKARGMNIDAAAGSTFI